MVNKTNKNTCSLNNDQKEQVRQYVLAFANNPNNLPMSRKLLRIAVVYGLVFLTTALSCCRVPPVRLEQATRWQLVPQPADKLGQQLHPIGDFSSVIFFGYTQGMAYALGRPYPRLMR